MAEGELEQLLANLQDPNRFPHRVSGFSLIETHISFVLLTGEYAYKFKKPVNLGFVDFSSLRRRAFYCREELRLNRRLAPELYLSVVRITGTPDDPQLDGRGPVIEFAVKMRQFDPQARLDRLLEAGRLEPRWMEDLAVTVARFHAALPRAEPDGPYGTPAQIAEQVRQNFSACEPCVAPPLDHPFEALRDWSERTLERLAPEFQARRAGGRVRECHGDMHLANMALLDGRPLIFDCIEFNPRLRWIDTISEVAFLVMDCDYRRHAALGQRFLNRYLEETGDYEGLRLLQHYRVYRAMVRAKVACIRARQGDPEAEAAFSGHLHLAADTLEPRPLRLVIMHGLSGTGKTTVARELAAALGAVQIRSDVERKRLAGLPPRPRRFHPPVPELYSAQMTERTYRRLLELARRLLDWGYPVIVDAAFLRRDERSAFHTLAEGLGIPFAIVHCEAPEAALRERLVTRQLAATDPSDADVTVLARQLEWQEPLAPAERRWAVTVDTSETPDIAGLAGRLLARP